MGQITLQFHSIFYRHSKSTSWASSVNKSGNRQQGGYIAQPFSNIFNSCVGPTGHFCSIVAGTTSHANVNKTTTKKKQFVALFDATNWPTAAESLPPRLQRNTVRWSKVHASSWFCLPAISRQSPAWCRCAGHTLPCRSGQPLPKGKGREEKDNITGGIGDVTLVQIFEESCLEIITAWIKGPQPNDSTVFLQA